MSTKEDWQSGETAWFEYHCWESLESSDALAWLLSHQRVTIVGRDPSKDDAWEGSTFDERWDAGQPKVYTVRFADGLEWTAFEDELLTEQEDFCKSDPPDILTPELYKSLASRRKVC